MFQYRLFKTISVMALGVSIAVCSGCAADFSGSFPLSSDSAVSSFSTSVSSEEVQTNNADTEYASGYSHVDFSQMDDTLVFANQRKGSLLGQPGYCYKTLSDEEQVVYEEIYAAVTGFADSCMLGTTDSELVHRVYNHVIADHPEIFWLEGYTLNTTRRGDKVISLEFSMKQTMEKEEVAHWQDVIRNYLEEFSKAAQDAGIDSSSDDFDIIKFTFDYIVTHTEYQESVENNQNICSVFGSGYSVCQGYSVAMQYLLLYQGIPSVTVSGVTRDTRTNHAWNLVRSDGEWYWLDVTWGDPSFYEDTKILNDMVNYAYFCVTDEEISRTHIVNDELELPECTSDKDNYFIHENRYFNSWDPEQFGQVIAECMKSGKGYASVRFRDEELYQQVRDMLIDKQKIFDYMKEGADETGIGEVSKLSYFENKVFSIITFIWEK